MNDENKTTKPEDEIAVPPPAPALDTTNRFLVSTHGDRLMIMTVSGMRAITKGEALSLIAWLAVLGDIEADEIAAAVKAVESC